MFALINPNQTAEYVKEWVLDTANQYVPVFDIYPNSQLVCDVALEQFEVASPLFWKECSSEVIATRSYFDSVEQIIKNIVDAPYPEIE